MNEATVMNRAGRGMAAASPHALTIGLMAFLTVVDLFATQAILPELARVYDASPAAIGTAVNACTLGMVIAGLAVAFLGSRIPRRAGVTASLTLLAIPTALLAGAPDLEAFALLRIAQGLFMATAFSLTLAHLAEVTSGATTSAAFAAYITGNVASNLLGRLLSASIAGGAGVAASFLAFAGLNLAGAVLAYAALSRMSEHAEPDATAPRQARPARVSITPELAATCAIGFCILFAFIGVFTYVNFVLAAPPIGLAMTSLGLVYLAFAPSILTTPLAGRLVARLGGPRTLRRALAVAIAGLPLLLAARIDAIAAGLTLVAGGTFLAQATASAHAGRLLPERTVVASGLYLAAYFLGGLVGSAVLGIAYMRLGWPACVAGVGCGLALACLLTRWIGPPTATTHGRHHTHEAAFAGPTRAQTATPSCASSTQQQE